MAPGRFDDAESFLFYVIFAYPVSEILPSFLYEKNISVDLYSTRYCMDFLPAGSIGTSLFVNLLAIGVLIVGVLSAVHHAEVVAHKVGEPYGTIILAVAVTVLEASIIVSLMLTGGAGADIYARDTLFAAVMLILNGILGISMLVGAIKFNEQVFETKSVTIALVSLVSILVLTLVLPNFTTSISGPSYSPPQLIAVAICCVVIYGSFYLHKR